MPACSIIVEIGMRIRLDDVGSVVSGGETRSAISAPTPLDAPTTIAIL